MKRAYLGPVASHALVQAMREVEAERREIEAEPVMVPIKDDPILYATSRNRHERRKAAALARMAAR